MELEDVGIGVEDGIVAPAAGDDVGAGAADEVEYFEIGVGGAIDARHHRNESRAEIDLDGLDNARQRADRDGIVTRATVDDLARGHGKAFHPIVAASAVDLVEPGKGDDVIVAPKSLEDIVEG